MENCGFTVKSQTSHNSEPIFDSIIFSVTKQRFQQRLAKIKAKLRFSTACIKPILLSRFGKATKKFQIIRLNEKRIDAGCSAGFQREKAHTLTSDFLWACAPRAHIKTKTQINLISSTCRQNTRNPQCPDHTHIWFQKRPEINQQKFVANRAQWG